MSVLQIYAVLVSAKKHQKCPKVQFQAPKLANLALHDDQMKSFCTKSAVSARRMAILLKKKGWEHNVTHQNMHFEHYKNFNN